MNYNFSSFAKSMLSRFLPCFPLNCTSTNSVPRSISLCKIIPSPNRSWLTLSPALNCCTFGCACSFGGVCEDGVVFCDSDDVTSRQFVCDGSFGGTDGEELDEGREPYCGEDEPDLEPLP